MIFVKKIKRQRNNRGSCDGSSIYCKCDIGICSSCFAIHWITLRMRFMSKQNLAINYVPNIKAQIVLYALETLWN